MKQNNAVSINLIDLKTTDSTYSIDSLVEQIDIYEDIGGNFITCDLAINDVNNLPKMLLGNETVTINITDSRDRVINVKFVLYDITNISTGTNTIMSYTLNLISEEALSSNRNRISKVYNNTSDGIIRSILSPNTNKEIITHIDEYRHTILIPNLNVFQAINFTSAFTKNFVFFETVKGFNYKNIENMLLQTSVSVFYKNNNKSPSDEHYYDILEDSEANRINNLTNISKGMYYKNITYTDVNTGTLSDVEYDYNKEFQTINTFGTEGFGNFEKYETKNDMAFGNKSSIYKNKLYRRSLMQQFQNNKLDIKIYANFQMETGKVIEIITGGVNMQYLITGLRHKIRNDGSYTIMELASNSR